MKKVREIKTYLSWMADSIDKIEEYSKGIDFDTFKSNNMIFDACLMQFQHLGELANKIKDSFPEENSLPYKEIIGFRNFIAHEYLGIDIEDVWETIIKDIPELKEKLKLLTK